MSEIRVPDDLWDGEKIPEGALSSWLYADGEAVQAGSAVATVMAEKTEYDVTSPAGGTLRIVIAEGEAVRLGQVIGKVE